jgi:hypothetical protein
VTATIPINNVTSITEANVTTSRLILLQSIGNYGPPNFAISEELPIPLEVTAPLDNITLVRLPKYADPDDDKV